MYCVHCGSVINDDSVFCRKCGNPVEVEPATQTETPAAPIAQHATPPSSSKPRNLTPIIIVAIVVVAVIIVAAFVTSLLGGSNNGNVTSTTLVSTSASSEAAQPWIKTKYFVLHEDMPGYSYRVSDDGYRVDLIRDNMCFASIFVVGHGVRENEARVRCYKLGTTDVDGSPQAVLLAVYYMNSKHSGIAHWGDNSATDLALSVFGVDDLALAKAIKLISGGDEVNSAPAIDRDDNASTSGSTSDNTTQVNTRTTPFWGVWIGASMSLDEANAIAAEARGYGMSAGVFLTTDWENLNSEPWYVVTVGVSSSESEANTELTFAQKYNADAYVKYSGAYKG